MSSRRNFIKKGMLAVGATAIPSSILKAQNQTEEKIIYKLPYKNTYNKESLVTENEYRVAKPETIDPKSFDEAKNILPEPIWKGHDQEIEMYWKAWQIGIGNIKAPQEGSGFVSSYIDTAYNGNIFMWDSAFITMFARYGSRFFPFQRTLDNFYAKQHPDGFICREIKSDGFDCFERYDPVSTGPNLLPWSEMVYYKHLGDQDRLNQIFPVLCAYYKWWKLNRTWQDGTYWSSGWGTGMDNMPRVKPQYNMIYSHGHMVWLDTCLQQILAANVLLEVGLYLERWQEIEEFEDEVRHLTDYVRKHMWSDENGFLHDRYADGSLCDTKGVGAYWALLIPGLLTREQEKKMIAHLDNEKEFKRTHRVPSLSADHPKYKDNGRYWQGGVWCPTNYMILQGLRTSGHPELAYEIAMNHYNNVFEVYKNTGTFWEYYSPERTEPGFMARPDFIGWTGLPPIAVLLENIIGLYPDFARKEIVWDIRQKEQHGVKRYPFGPQGNISFLASERSGNSLPQLTVDSNVPFTLIAKCNGKEKRFEVKEGKQTYQF